jgi:hypothetical protein
LTVSTYTVKSDTVNVPKLAVPLTDIQPRTAKPKDKPYKLADDGGLYLLVNTNGAKYWRMDYRFADVRRTLAFGKYPEVTLADARNKRLAARKLLDQDIDPGQEKRQRESARMQKQAPTRSRSWRETGAQTSCPPGARRRRAIRFAAWRSISFLKSDRCRLAQLSTNT